MSLNKYIILFVILAAIANATKTSYEGYKLYQIVPKDDNEVNILKEIQKKNLGDFWSDIELNYDVRILVAPSNVGAFLEQLGEVKAKAVIENVQRAIEDQLKPADTRSSESYLSYNWSEYHDLETIYNWLDELEKNHSGVVNTVVMGRTVEGRDIKGIVINYKPEKTNPLIGVIEGALHAREWISPATVTWIIKEFLTSTDAEVRALAENFEWHIFPVVNPDGYSYTFTDNRMWRKNRNTENFKSCEHLGVDDDMSNGIDLNRNFDFEWMSIGASDDACSNTYAGPTAFSEPETRAIAQYVGGLNERGEIIYYIAFHSYTQLIVIPYSHVTNVNEVTGINYGDMYEIAVRGADALRQRYGTVYRPGISADIMYPMSGTSFDWVKKEFNVPVTYLIELRDLGAYGFLLPAEQIIPNNLEIMDALLEMDRTTKELKYYSADATSVLYSALVLVVGVIVALMNSL